jgi:hypothetical protein
MQRRVVLLYCLHHEVTCLAIVYSSAILHYYHVLPLDSIIDEFGPIMSVAILTGFAMSFAVYVASLVQGTQHRMSGNHFYDFGPLFVCKCLYEG